MTATGTAPATGGRIMRPCTIPGNLGGARPWFRCSASVDGRPCGRRVANLYLRDAAEFACRQCCGSAYASQSENPRYRAISRVQKARMRLGWSANLLERFPEKPRGMHRRTYYRLLARAMAGSGALDRPGARLYPSALSRSSEPGERRRGLISTAIWMQRAGAGGLRGKFLKSLADRGRGWSLPGARRRRWGPCRGEPSAPPIMGPKATREGAAVRRGQAATFWDTAEATGAFV